MRADVVAMPRRLNEEFVEAIRANKAGTLFYRSLQSVEDPSELLNCTIFADAAAEQRHRTTLHVRGYVEQLHARCVKKLVFTDFSVLATTQSDQRRN
jgi:quinol monooxygenase YgiN